MKYEVIAQSVVGYAKTHGRLHLPWKQPASPYRVWISEVMLQQTQVQTVLDYFQRFMARFPDIFALAQASIEEVLQLWAGLGYYRRAHFLHQTAILICQKFEGEFPSELETLMSLPGIGRSTAGAILSQAMHLRAPILDGNVKRVLCRYYQIPGYPESPANLKKLWAISEQWTPSDEVALYTQGIMDLGANLCTKKSPDCAQCPLNIGCGAFAHNTQTLYPEPKPRKSKPTKRCLFGLIFNAHDQVLLLKRPNHGIWGGLWCLPSIRCLSNFEISKNPILESVCRVNAIGPKLKHVFTHFNLEYKPVKMLAQKPFAFKEREMKWVSPTEAVEHGLPAPIKKLIEGELI